MARRIERSHVTLFVFAVLALLHQVTVQIGHKHWLLDIVSHMQLQVFVLGTVLLLLLFLWSRSRLLLVLGGAYLLGLCWWIFVGTSFLPHTDTSLPIDIYYQNVRFNQSDEMQKQLADAIATYPADMYAFVEPNTAFLDQFEKNLGVEATIRYGQGGISCAVFIRNELYQARDIEVYRTDRHDPLCVVHFAYLDLYVVHPLPPLSRATFERQTEYFKTLATMLAVSESRNREWVVVGDFNSTKYSSLFRKFFGAHITQQQYSWGWPGPRTIPIDHAFSSGHVEALLYPSLTSDHRGLGVVLGRSKKPAFQL